MHEPRWNTSEPTSTSESLASNWHNGTLALNTLLLAHMEAARLMVNELRLARDIVAASVNEPNEDQTAAQQDLYEACVEKALRRTEEFDAAVRKNARDIEKPRWSRTRPLGARLT